MRCRCMIDYALQGLKDQAEERLAVASCPCNLFRWQPPRVIFFFPEVLVAPLMGTVNTCSVLALKPPLLVTS